MSDSVAAREKQPSGGSYTFRLTQHPPTPSRQPSMQDSPGEAPSAPAPKSLSDGLRYAMAPCTALSTAKLSAVVAGKRRDWPPGETWPSPCGAGPDRPIALLGFGGLDCQAGQAVRNVVETSTGSSTGLCLSRVTCSMHLFHPCLGIEPYPTNAMRPPSKVAFPGDQVNPSSSLLGTLDG